MAAVVLVHGAGLDSGEWDEVVSELGPGLDPQAHDRTGYGTAPTPDHYRGTTVERQAEDLAGVAGEHPVLLCGAGFGAIVCLDFLVRHPGKAIGAVLIEPPLLSLAAGGAEALSELREAIEAAAGERGVEGAVDVLLGAPELIGPERLERAHGAGRSALADFAAVPAWDFTRRGLAAVEVPVVVIRGERSSPAIREAAAALAQMLGCAALREARAGHVVAIEDPGSVATAVRSLLV